MSGSANKSNCLGNGSCAFPVCLTGKRIRSLSKRVKAPAFSGGMVLVNWALSTAYALTIFPCSDISNPVFQNLNTEFFVWWIAGTACGFHTGRQKGREGRGCGKKSYLNTWFQLHWTRLLRQAGLHFIFQSLTLINREKAAQFPGFR